MSHAIGQYLIGAHGNLVEPEAPHPGLAGRHIDFAIRGEEPDQLVDVIETKLVTDKRDYRQEVFDDLVRLELATPHLHGGHGWLLIAGLGQHIREWIVEDPMEGEQPEDARLQGILSPVTYADPITVSFDHVTNAHKLLWSRSVVNRCGGIGASSLTTHLEGRWLMDDAIGWNNWMCMIWRVSSLDQRVLLDAAAVKEWLNGQG